MSCHFRCVVKTELTLLLFALQEDMAVKNGRYQINMDVVLFPWKLTYKGPGSGLVPKGSFGKVHLAQDTATRKRMACKLVSAAEQCVESISDTLALLPNI